MKRVYEMKNNCWLFEMPFKIQENGAFLLEMSLFVLKIQRILHGREDMNFMFEWQEQDLTSERSERVRYCFCHSNIKFISSS